MGVELELYVLLTILVLGSSIFAAFHVETARWRKVRKWVIMSGVTVGLYYTVGHLALIFPLGLTAIGTGFHFWWCRKHGIDPIHATPRHKYDELRRVQSKKRLRTTQPKKRMSVDRGFHFTKSAAVLILANLVTIGFAVWESWRLIDVLWIYWAQSCTMTFFTWRRILNLKQFSQQGILSMEATREEKKHIAGTFLSLYVLFHLMYLVFLNGVGGSALGMRDMGFAVCILAFAVNHTFSYFHNRQEDLDRIPDVSTFMMYPGLRSVPMLGALGTILPVDDPGLSMLQFLVLKGLIDVIMHIWQHAAMKAKP